MIAGSVHQYETFFILILEQCRRTIPRIRIAFFAASAHCV